MHYGTLIKFGVGELAIFLITAILFVILVLLVKPIEEDDVNEIMPVGKLLILSSFVVQVAKMFFKEFLIYDLLSSIMFAVITYIFYKIFANSIVVIKEYRQKQAFAIEEVMGACLLLSIAFSSFSKFAIFGFSLTNILSIMLVLFMGWKNGMLVGGTTGITIGMVLGIINSGSPVLIATYAISGMIAGILNRFGKIGVIIGFCVGNAVLTYAYNGNTLPIITIREILIASLGLLVLPKNININIKDILAKDKYLPTTAGILDGEIETVNKLNSVSETISEMAKSYDEAAINAMSEDERLRLDAKQSFEEDLLNNMEDFPENFLYDEILENEESIINDIYEVLEKNTEMTDNILLEILHKNNNYIISVDSSDETVKAKIEQDIVDIVKTINATYRINKLNIIWKQKEASNKKVLATQLGGVSKVISSIAEDIKEKPIQNKEEEKYSLEIAVASKTKDKGKISGDSYTQTKLNDGKLMIAISDGMGSRSKSK